MIRNLISLEEEALITEQVEKLKLLPVGEGLHTVIFALEAKAYSTAMAEIDVYLKQSAQMLVYIDPEIEGLRLEARTLEAKLDALNADKSEIEKAFYEFNVRYQQELGELMLRLLKLRREKLREEAKNDNLKEDSFREAEADYEAFEHQYIEVADQKILELTDEQQKDLTSLFRQACKLCHPDKVTEDLKERATQMFIDLKNAYDLNDIRRVKQIIEQLQRRRLGNEKVEVLSDKEQLRKYVQELQNRIANLHEEIETFKKSENYEVVALRADWDAFFEKNKSFLEDEIALFLRR